MTTVDMEQKDAVVETAEQKSHTDTPGDCRASTSHGDDDAPRVVEPEATEGITEEPVLGSDSQPSKDIAAETGSAKNEQSSAGSIRPGAHAYSHSYGPSSNPLKETLSIRKSNSTTELPIITSETADASREPPTLIRRLPSSLSSSSVDDSDISTIPDPRLRLQKLTSGMKNADPEDEITALSTKLIDAINHQSSLDDTLSRTRMELEESREQVRKLQQLSARQKEFLSGGLWVRKSTVEDEKAVILAKTREEKRLRLEAEEAKLKMELELESLTAELFEQANIMVAAAKEEARAEQIAANRRYDNLKAQLVNTEGLLKSQQEQLSELKQVMEEMITNEGMGRDDQTTALTTPTSPGFGQLDFKDADVEPGSEKGAEASAEGETPIKEATADPTPARESTTTIGTVAGAAAVSPSFSPSPDSVPLSPSQPMSFTHLIRPVLRYDTIAFHEFVDLIRTAQIQLMLQQQQSQQSHARSPSSTSLPKTPPMGTTGWNGHAGPTSVGVTSAVPMTAVNAFASVTSGLAISSNSNSPQNHTKELKETKFYKRVVVEDIEPALRLDTAPGISWLVRRNILSAVLEGTLVAEPVPNTSGAALLIQNPCSMCGESRRQDSFLRHHRFRLTESDKSTPYPLCNYCLNRVRSVCGFLVFLRMLKEGHWRAADEDAEQVAWEECVRLREHMFWARIGGGVLPANGASSNGGTIGFARHSRIAGGGSSAQNSINFQANGQTSDHPAPSRSTRPSGEFVCQVNSPSKINVSNSPVPSPLSSPAITAGLGIEPTDRSPASPSPAPSRPSKLSATVAAVDSGVGSHDS